MDVTVKGAGIFGLSVAWACARRGAAVRVIDPHGVAAGASGGPVGALAPHAPENWTELKAFQLDALLAAEAWWGAVAARSGADPLYARSGRLQPVADAAALERATLRGKAASELWRGRAVWRIAQASDWPDWAPASPTGLVVYDTLSGRLHPRAATAALAKAIGAAGGEIVAQAAVEGALVDATGAAGLAELGKAMGRAAGRGVKGQAARLACDRRGAPQLYAGGLHIVAHGDGSVAVGSTTEPQAAGPTGTDAALEAVIARARTICPALATAPVIERWAGLRPRATSRGPVLGRHPARDGAYVANGGFKIGFGLAPGVGEAMADLILEARDRIPAAFKPEALP